ncbi:innexin inx2-like [Cylas formicarius]|uniref:innexin inx2-like n=1 Tax=Cylas formicarius TaxID=197179 RepID=UPI0029588736|nr:innexin inx2-like [Cylas formicarius]
MQTFVKGFKTWAKLGDVQTENVVFKIHCKITVLMLILFSVLLSSKQYFGDPIDCDVAQRKEIVNLYCWTTGTFIIDKKVEGSSDLQGLGNLASAGSKETFTLLYYQWVWFLFLLQALCFYAPKHVWRLWERRQLAQIIQDLCGPLVTEKWTLEYKEKIVSYLLHARNLDIYSFRFAVCEFLTLVNLIFQILLMNWYLKGEYLSYGVNVATGAWPESMNRVFPKRAKCNYTRYGASGSVESRDALCVLPLNTLNEKFFLILWYYFAVLMILTIGALTFRFLFLYSGKVREHLLKMRVAGHGIGNKKIKTIVEHLSHGQFFALHHMSKNLNPIIFDELLVELLGRVVRHRRDNSISVP